MCHLYSTCSTRTTFLTPTSLVSRQATLLRLPSLPSQRNFILLESSCWTFQQSLIRWTTRSSSPPSKNWYNFRRICSFLTQEAVQFWSRLLLSWALTTATCSGPVCLHVPPDLCGSSRQWPSWSSTYSSFLPHYIAPPFPILAKGGCLNPIQDTGTCLPYWEWLRPILYPNHTPPAIHHALSANWLATPSLWGGPGYHSTKSQLSWPYNGGTSFALISGQQKLYKSQEENSSVQTASWPIRKKYCF